jgi:hypothetical protein
MYATRTGLRIAAPRSIFGWLALAAVLNRIALVALGLTFASLLTLFVGVSYSTVESWIGWSYLVAEVALSLSWTMFGLIVVFSTNVIDVKERPLMDVCMELARSRWARASAVSYGLVIGADIIVKFIDSDRVVDWVLLVGLVGFVGAGWHFARTADRELRRIARVSKETPLFMQEGGYCENSEAGRFAIEYGADWVHPAVLCDVEIARKFRKAAADRSSVLYFVGKGLPLLFGSTVVACFVWSFDGERPPFAAALPVALLAVVLIGWHCERSAGRFDGLAKEYEQVVRMKAGVERAVYRTMTWVDIPCGSNERARRIEV